MGCSEKGEFQIYFACCSDLTGEQDPELWFPDGTCLVHLYGRGQSKRGPAFRLPLSVLLEANCRPLLDRFMAQDLNESPISEFSSSEDGSYFGQPQNYGRVELYIPAPPAAERGEAFLYHTATRNFFAWVFGRSLVGTHLGGALVGLLNSMNEFRSTGQDNIQAIMEYMDEEGYADMRNHPDHALGVLFFAEHFQFRDLWIDAFVHTTGMHDRLHLSPGFEVCESQGNRKHFTHFLQFMTRTTRALITRSRMEMDMRLEHAGSRLSSFLSDDLSDSHLGLSTGARAHLDKFRSFLQSFYVAKLGYYPPKSQDGMTAAFPKSIYRQMCSEFRKLYDFLVDYEHNSADSVISQQGGICVLQSVQAFDARHKYPSLSYPLPLLPEVHESATSKPTLSRRLSFHPINDKMKPDPRLVAYSSLSKATNCRNASLLDCSLVRAYQGFEKECIFSQTKSDKGEKISIRDARKVRWLLIYSIYQTLLSVTEIPKEVTDIQNVPYNLCVLTAGCPPWKEERAIETMLRTQTDQMKEDFETAHVQSTMPASAPSTPYEIKPDIDYFAITHKSQDMSPSAPRAPSMLSRKGTKKGTVLRALSTLGNMPELHHPRPKRASLHEILVYRFRNGTNAASITASTALPQDEEEQARKISSDSGSSAEDISSRWSNSSVNETNLDSPQTSMAASRRGSADSNSDSKNSIKEFLDRPMTDLAVPLSPSSLYPGDIESSAGLQPHPLRPRKTEQLVKVTNEVKVGWEEDPLAQCNEELLAYLES